MKISIIVPTFNSEKVIRRCLESIVFQTFQDWEVLLIDGASKDDTVHIAESFADPRIRIYSEPDRGIYDAMNKGIDKATGDWLYFLGSDDNLYDEHVLDFVANELDDKYDVVYGEVDSSLPDCHRGEWNLETLHANRCHQCIFYHHSFFSNGLRYNLRYKLLADYDLNLRWFLGKKYSSKYIPVTVAHYSMDGVSSDPTNSSKDLLWDDIGKNKLCYGWRTLPPLYKKRAAKNWADHAQTPWQYFVAKMIWCVCYVLSKLQKK